MNKFEVKKIKVGKEIKNIGANCTKQEEQGNCWSLVYIWKDGQESPLSYK